MSSPLLVIAEVAGHVAEPVSSGNIVTQLTETFGLNVPAILAQIVSFTVVAWVLW